MLEQSLDARLEYWTKQINMFGKQSIYWDDIKMIEDVLKELRNENSELRSEVEYLDGELGRSIAESNDRV